MARKEALIRLHERLVARRDALRKALKGDLDALRAIAAMDNIGDTVDAAHDTANEEVNSQLIEIESRELEQIEYALQRITRGVYGRCEVCTHKIPEARINALPYTTTCIDCQREYERHGRSASKRFEDLRWAQIYDKETADTESHVNLNDLEFDLSESGR